MKDTVELPAKPSTSAAEAAWAARRVIDPDQLGDARLPRCRHPGEWQALLSVGAVILGLEVVLSLLGPEHREAIRSKLQFLPHGVVGTIEKALHPGGAVGTVLIFLLGTAVLDLHSHWLK